MFNKRFFKNGAVAVALSGVLVLSACGGDDASSGNDTNNNNDADTNYSEAIEHTIIGIEPGAGISVTTEKAIEQYDSLQGWSVELSSTAAMATELDKAMDKEEPIIITGWNPHWTFAKYPDMKYLEDPKGLYGGSEDITTLARKGLKDDKPNAYKMIDQFNWEVEDMEGIMYDAKESGEDISEVAARWVEDNADRVAEWSEGVDDVDGVEVELISTPWDSERASSSVLKIAMEEKGFEVSVTPVEPPIVFQSIAEGNGDATLAAWLPVTHKDFYEKHEADMDNLGANLSGAKIGLVVPSYMDIESIEDLQPNE
ncbi:glycine betaine ABC transporter substrate-binding protein [Lentibacillus saliphilus]|uniref:glycine betaine ABC transporter substrate-binding protein n=1 Tax=Lentibacillus saliphilus TaxID=2737028 RepID=UPI001C306A97|nr:glycine betaine ABC transporter substrate-binding protein [Lentibacillus saliphilus]